MYRLQRLLFGRQLGVPIRCTQNPTMGEEWRKGWHPEDRPPGAQTRGC
jgi:hypothetical protein